MSFHEGRAEINELYPMHDRLLQSMPVIAHAMGAQVHRKDSGFTLAAPLSLSGRGVQVSGQNCPGSEPRLAKKVQQCLVAGKYKVSTLDQDVKFAVMQHVRVLAAWMPISSPQR